MNDHPPTRSFIELLADDELRELKRLAQPRSFRAREIIFRQGDQGDGVYVVEEGCVEISAVIHENESRVLARIGAGSFFGEMAVLDGLPRSATATAEVDTIVSFISGDEMLNALAKSPQLLTLLVKEFSLRMRQFDRHFLEEVLQAERLTLVGRFAQSIVHDFKNPLNIIGFASALMGDEGVTAEIRAEMKTQISRQVERLTNMTNELLEFTRGSARSLTLEPTDYGEFIDAFLKDIEPETREKAVKVVCENPAPSLALSLDRGRLLHVFYNLTNNAIDVLADGGTVTLRFRLEDDKVITELEDSGPGLAPEIRSRLFQPFATHGKKQGTGLGLSICKRIIEDHGGQIHARSEPGRGAIFEFSLLRPPEAAPRP